MRYLLVLLALALSGCSETPPVTLSEQEQKFIGVWQLRHEEESQQRLRIDNMLLIVHANAQAMFRACEIELSESNNLTSRSRLSTELPDAQVTDISDESITLTQKLGWFEFDFDLTMTREPYQHAGHWYLEVEGKRLIKLSTRESENATQWQCPEFTE